MEDNPYLEAPAAEPAAAVANPYLDESEESSNPYLTEERSTLDKSRMAAAGAAAQTVAEIGTAAKRLADIGPFKANFRRHEAAMVRAGEEQVPYDSALGELQQEHEERRQLLMQP